MQSGTLCYCGNTYATSSQYIKAADSECSTFNAGRSGYWGGSYRNAIYRNAADYNSPVLSTGYGATACTSCPSGTFSLIVGASGGSVCTTCASSILFFILKFEC